MKRFDFTSNFNRHVKRMSQFSDWASQANKGTISNLLKSISLSEENIAQYINFLAIEKKFRTAHTLSAIQTQTDLIGYQRKLPKSAFGYVIVSHSDADGVNRLANLGTYFFDIDAASDYDDLVLSQNASAIQRKALVPWTADSQYIIPEGTIFTAESGITFISTETVESRALKEPFNIIKNDPEKYNSFIEAGGWDGIKYLKVPVIQGIQKSLDLGYIEGKRFESFVIDSLDIENALSKVSSKYFNVTITADVIIDGVTVPGTPQTWRKVNDIHLASSEDKVFDVTVLSEQQQVMIRFGNDLTGAIPPAGARITVNYLETLGEDGNVSDRYSVTSMAFPSGEDMIDPRTQTKSEFLSCTNAVAIMGGKNIENIDDIKLNAPSSYLLSRAVATKDSYYEQICMNSPASLLTCKVFSTDATTAASYGTDNENNFVTSVSDSVIQEVRSSRPSLLISAIKANGKLFDDAETELIEPLEKYMSDAMAPIDSLSYIKPNLVKLRLNLLAATSDSVEESTLSTELKDDLVKFSIFGRDFEESFYTSQIDDTVNQNTHINYIDSFYEAIANVDLTPEIYSASSQSGTSWLSEVGFSGSMDNYDLEAFNKQSLLAFNFSFDKIFGQNNIEPGFKNYKYNAPYVLRVDLRFASDDSKNRTLFLYDHRNSDVTLEEGKKLAIDSTKASPNTSIDYYGSNSVLQQSPNTSAYRNAQTRVAQFPLIDKVTSPAYMAQLNDFKLSPSEIRPYEVDYEGNLKIYNKEDVAAQNRVSMAFGKMSSDAITCYKKDDNYIDKCAIEFSEEYNDVTSAKYATGKIILPLAYVFSSADIDSLKVAFENISSFSDQADELKLLLQDELTIDVYALPIQKAFDTEKEYDLISLDVDKSVINKL